MIQIMQVLPLQAKEKDKKKEGKEKENWKRRRGEEEEAAQKETAFRHFFEAAFRGGKIFSSLLLRKKMGAREARAKKKITLLSWIPPKYCHYCNYSQCCQESEYC